MITHAFSPRMQWRALEWVEAVGLPACPVLYGGMIGRADEDYPRLAFEIRNVKRNCPMCWIDWEPMTLRNQNPGRYYAALAAGAVTSPRDPAAAVHRIAAAVQADLLIRCRSMRPDVKQWGVFNFPRTWYRSDGKQPEVDPQVLAYSGVFGPSWYQTDPWRRMVSVARCSELDASCPRRPWVKPANAEECRGHDVVCWHQADDEDGLARAKTAVLMLAR